jgi:predicted RNA-binding Zn-ribbon protein involved in translation (DUF1610 family)
MCMHEPYQLESIPAPTAEQIIRHHITGDLIKPEHVAAAEKELLQYLFISKEEKTYSGFCIACGRDIKNLTLEFAKHNKKTFCPNCGREVTAKNVKLSRKRLKEIIYLLYYYKSEADPNVVVGVGGLFQKDCNCSPQNIKTISYVQDVFIFEQGKGGKKYTTKSYWDAWQGIPNLMQDFYLSRVCTRNGFSNGFGWMPIDILENRASLMMSIAAAGMKHCMVTETFKLVYPRGNAMHVEIMDFCLKYPCVEYLFKMGQSKLVEEKQSRYNDTRGIINWKGKTAQAVLKLTKEQLGEVRKKKIILTLDMLRLLKALKEEKVLISMGQLAGLKDHYGYSSVDSLKKAAATSGKSILFIINYLNKKTSNSPRSICCMILRITGGNAKN